jgi:sarcosine oxidase delta subunit
MPRPLLCPICKSPVVQELNRTGDAIGYRCATHSAFKVADTVFAEQRAKDYTREQWEAALRKAKQRTKPGEWPLITSNDF